MTLTRDFTNRCLRRALLSTGLAVLSAGAVAQEAPIVQPGAPGQPSRMLAAEDAIDLAGQKYSIADVRFMQDMIPHHNQAREMAALVAERTERTQLVELAERIEKSQKDEIAFMSDWLEEHDAEVPDPDDYDAMRVTHKMAGMASPEDMERLAELEGGDFDRLFLELMIEHHQGAITMVDDLLEQPGAAADPAVFEFVTDVNNDQSAEIERMSAMLTEFSPDPRTKLAPGFRDAGEAIQNLTLVESLPKPPGFFDPDNPASLPEKALRDEEEKEDEDTEENGEDEENGDGGRPPLLSFANTDFAFGGDFMVMGSYHGFNIYDIAGDGRPDLISSVVCPGGQGDVSISGDLLVMSVEQSRGRVDCGLEGVAGKVSEERFRGLRIFDISDLTRPVQVGGVQTCRGSHTHSIISGPGEDGKLIVYNSGTAPVREEEELEGCSDEPPYRDDQTALFRIDVIEIPVDRPQDARIVDSPAVFADPESGSLAGLWGGGDHGPRTQSSRRTDHCHDITAFPELGIAAGACSGNGLIFDISDPLEPKRIDEVVDPSFAYWHSATFNNDGTKVLFTDEWGGGGRPRCRASDPQTWGADAIYDIVDRELEFRSYYKMPAPQTDQENCVAHNGSIVPVPGRDIFVQAWYQGGISIVDFTNSTDPVEIAYFDRGPIHEEEMVLGGFWSAYWYDGLIYASEIVRGLDVLALEPSEYLSENEIAAASHAVGGALFNPQTQLQLRWEPVPVVGRAYLDQLRRGGDLADDRLSSVSSALDRAEAALSQAGADAATADRLDVLAAELAQDGRDLGMIARKRITGLRETLTGIAARLR